MKAPCQFKEETPSSIPAGSSMEAQEIYPGTWRHSDSAAKLCGSGLSRRAIVLIAAVEIMDKEILWIMGRDFNRVIRTLFGFW